MKTQDQSQSPSEEEIAQCAYQIWEDEGHPHGKHEIHWHKASLLLPAAPVEEK